MARTKTIPSLARPALQVCNRQKTRRLNLTVVRQLVRRILEEGPFARGRDRAGKKFSDGGQLGVHFIQADEMACLNKQFLGHAGSTDVITFDYQEGAEAEGWCGEIFVSVDDAVASAPRFRATWQLELARYLVHGMLHLRGYNDHGAAARREMKKEENRVLKALSRRFDWGTLEKVKHVVRRK